MKIFLFCVLCFFLSGSLACGEQSLPPPTKLIGALIYAESLYSGYEEAVGDKCLKNKAYGCLQIRKPCVDDVNKACGTKYKAEDCLGNRELSFWIFERYMELYATKARIGRDPTDQDRARIWNGGPNGWKKKSTLEYWKKVKKALEAE